MAWRAHGYVINTLLPDTLTGKNWITIPQPSVASSDITSSHASMNNISDKRTHVSSWRMNMTVGRVSIPSLTKELGRSAFSRRVKRAKESSQVLQNCRRNICSSKLQSKMSTKAADWICSDLRASRRAVSNWGGGEYKSFEQKIDYNKLLSFFFLPIYSITSSKCILLDHWKCSY